MIQLYISNTLIPEYDVVSIPKIDSALSMGDKILAASSSAVLDNCSQDYGDMNPLSIFYGTNWYGLPYLIYDSDQDVNLFAGKITNLTQNDNNMSVTVEASSYLSDVMNKTLVYTNASISVADAIYYILVTAGGIPAAYVNYSTFASIGAYHTAQSMLVSLNYTQEHNITCASVLNELCRISSCGLYTRDSIIYLYNYVEYTGAAEIEVKALVNTSFQTTYKTDKFNSFNIAYDNAGTVAYATGTLVGATDLFKFDVPNSKIDSTTSTDFRILYTNATGATYAGNLILSQYGYNQKKAKFQLPYQYNFFDIGDQLDLTYGDYYREPITITSFNPDSNKRLIDVEGVFRNLPVAKVSRNVTRLPAPSVTAEVFGHYIEVTFTVIDDPTFAYYKLYFGLDKGSMTTESCYTGQSPINVATFSYESDHLNHYLVKGLEFDKEFWFAATAINSDGNESELSNYDSAIVSSVILYPQRITSDGSVRELSDADTRRLSQIIEP